MAEQPADNVQADALEILIVVDSHRDNGGLRVAFAYGRHWAERGSPTCVAAVQDVTDDVLTRPSPAVRAEFLGWRNGRLRQVLPIALARLIKLARRSDVLLSGSEEGIGIMLTYLAARLTRRPFVVLAQADIDDSIATWVPRRLQRANRFVLARADAAISVADSIVPGLVANGLPRERITVVLNGIDVQDVRDQAGLDAMGSAPRDASPDRVPTVLGLGRLAWEKDFALLIRAHAKVLAAGVEHRLEIVGRGPMQGELEELVAELGVADSVGLVGYVDDPYQRMAAADLFVLSSRSEGMPLTVLEALAVGTPVIATRCSSGVDLLLEGGRYGDMVPAESVDELADAIEKNLRDPSALQARAAAGPARARTFDFARSSEAAHRVLRDVVEPASGTPAGVAG